MELVAPNNVLSVSNLGCIRGERVLFKNLSFDLNSGKLLYVQGENGSGKTTLLRTLCALSVPAAGEIAWNSQTIKTLAEDYTGQVLYIGHLAEIKEDLIEVLGNLLDNACKWCNKQVSLTVISGDGIAFIIEDDGAGASLSDLEHLTKRNFRADESKPGSGLGLDDIVESYSGTISFAQSQALGGLRVEVKLN